MDHASGPSSLVRYGVMGHVGRFLHSGRNASTPVRGQSVVIRSLRGIELGEVLLSLDGQAEGIADRDDQGRPELLRIAGDEDLERLRDHERRCAERLGLCREILQDGAWPIELIDAEALLSPDLIVLHCICPDQFDLSPLRAMLRARCEFDVLFEPANGGSAEPIGAQAAGTLGPAGVRSCGDCDCSGQGCNSAGDGEPGGGLRAEDDGGQEPQGQCGPVAHRGCASCGVSKWRSTRANAQQAPAAVP